MAFLTKAETTYIFPTELKPIFKFFLKSRNLKSLITLLKSHSTEEQMALIELLKSSICWVRTAFLKGAWRWTLSGYAGSPYRHKGWPAGSKEFVANSSLFLSRPALLLSNISKPYQDNPLPYHRFCCSIISNFSIAITVSLPLVITHG